MPCKRVAGNIQKAKAQLEEIQQRQRMVEEAAGFAAQLADIEEVSAFHGDNYEVLVHRYFVRDRSVMFDLVEKPDLAATSSDDSVLAALEHARAFHTNQQSNTDQQMSFRNR